MEGHASKCCEYHISIFYPEQGNIQPDPKQKKQLILMDKLFQLVNQISELNENLICFEGYLLCKVSPCLQLLIFKTLKHFLVEEGEE